MHRHSRCAHVGLQGADDGGGALQHHVLAGLGGSQVAQAGQGVATHRRGALVGLGEQAAEQQSERGDGQGWEGTEGIGSGMISHRLDKHDGHGAGEREGRVVAGDKTDKVW